MSARVTMRVAKACPLCGTSPRAEKNAFVRGFAAAAAMSVRYHTNLEDLLRAGGLTIGVMKRAGVEAFDLDELAPEARKLERKATRRKAASLRPEPGGGK